SRPRSVQDPTDRGTSALGRAADRVQLRDDPARLSVAGRIQPPRPTAPGIAGGWPRDAVPVRRSRSEESGQHDLRGNPADVSDRPLAVRARVWNPAIRRDQT